MPIYKYFKSKSTDVGDLRGLKSIEFSCNHMSIGSKVSVNYPLTSLHEWEFFIFGQPVNSVARLSKYKRGLLLHYSLDVLFAG